MVLRNGSNLSSDWSEATGDAGSSQAIRVDELDHFDEDWVKPFPLRDGVKVRKGEKFSDYYTLYEEIGEGKFGKVYRCMEKATELMLAAKCIKIRKDTDFEKVEKEVNIMTQMRHKCIAQAIRYIHSQNIIHLDLKPENIMCVSQSSNQIKLIDFGLAQWYDGSKDLMFMAGTPEFAAPEVIKYEPLDFHTDMWSLGVIAYILLSGQSPFLGETLAHTYCNVERGNWMFCEEFAENGISSEAKDFISKLLIVPKEKRILPDKCLSHPWIVKNRERALLASRAASPACQPLAVDKFRKYVKNKRFRRLVFGVLFINQVMRMMQTMKRNKSANGVEYVRSMLAAAEAASASDGIESEVENDGGRSLLLKTFSKAKKEEKMEIDERKEEEVKHAKKEMVEVKKEGGEKKKRSKSEARRAADQQRTRSSTEQTFSKKQKQEGEERTTLIEGAAEEGEGTRRSKSREPEKTVKTVKFEEKPIETKSPMSQRKRLEDGQVLRIAARMQEEPACTPSTSTGKKEPTPEPKKMVSTSNVSALLKRLEKKGAQTQEGIEPGRSRLITPIPIVVVEFKPEIVREADGGGMKKKVLKKKVRRVRTAEEEDQRQRRREEVTKKEQPQQRSPMVERRELKRAAFRERIAEMERMGGGEGETKMKILNGREGEEMKKREEERHDWKKIMAKGRSEEEVRNGHHTGDANMDIGKETATTAAGKQKLKEQANGIILDEKMKKKQQQFHTDGMLSPRAKQRLKLSKSNPLNNKFTRRTNDSVESMDEGWGVVGQDVFDFSLLRKKLQNRILGLKDKEDLETEAENQHRFELQKQQKMLQTNLNIKRAMRKWISMDKETKQHIGGGRRGSKLTIIPDWAH